MADIVDDANDRCERDLELAIAAVRGRPRPVANGSCYYCHEDVKPNLLYCCGDCRLDYEEEKRIRERQGIR